MMLILMKSHLYILLNNLLYISYSRLLLLTVSMLLLYLLMLRLQMYILSLCSYLLMGELALSFPTNHYNNLLTHSTMSFFVGLSVDLQILHCSFWLLSLEISLVMRTFPLQLFCPFIVGFPILVCRLFSILSLTFFIFLLTFRYIPCFGYNSIMKKDKFQNITIFTDFDGVLFDTLNEAYVLCQKSFHNIDIFKPIEQDSFKKFARYKFLVFNSWQYLYLMKCLDNKNLLRDEDFINK